ncbi:MAG: hypothetical protein RLY70_1613 [Planctomycetota bacterium]
MDQVKMIMRVLVAQRFWVLSGVVTVIGAVIYFMAVSKLDKEQAERASKIDGQYSGVTAARGIQNHPNDFSHKKMDDVENLTRESVGRAWQRQYERQLDVLVWPKELKEDFEAAVINLRPVESIPFPTPLSKEISVELRARYRDYIQGVLPKLATIINASWAATAASGGMGGSGLGGFGGGPGMMPGAGGGAGPGAAGGEGMPGGAGMAGGAGMTGAEDDKFVVAWNPSNQGAIMARYDWSKQAENVPKTLQILYSQEDYWVLTSIMQIIARTNEGADARYKAAVKRIDGIDLGVYAQRSGQVTRLGGGGAAGGMPGAAGMMPGGGEGGMVPGMMPGKGGPAAGGMGGGGMAPGMGGPGAAPGMGGGGGMAPGMGGMAGMGGMGGATADVDPLENRYVDVDLNPVQAETARNALTVATATDAILAVAKRMPVRLQLQVDIRRLNRLLAECGNANLPLEIRQVRINPPAGGAGGGGMGGGAMAGGGMPMMGNMGAGAGGGAPPPMGGEGGMMGGGAMGGGAMGGMMGGMGRGRVATIAAQSYDVNVELFGLVYIYNPPNQSKLGTAPTASLVAPAPASSAVAAAPAR